MPWIQNVSLIDLQKGHHIRVTPTNSVLIQICDPGHVFPTPFHKFTQTHRFEFLDSEENDAQPEELRITDAQAAQERGIVIQALVREMLEPGELNK